MSMINVTIGGTASPPAAHHNHWLTGNEYMAARAAGEIPQTAAGC